MRIANSIPTVEEIEIACQELSWLGRDGLLRHARLAQPYIERQDEYAAQLLKHMRLEFPELAEDRLATVASAIMILARAADHMDRQIAAANASNPVSELKQGDGYVHRLH